MEHLLYVFIAIHDGYKYILLLPAVADTAECHKGLLMADLWSPIQLQCDWNPKLYRTVAVYAYWVAYRDKSTRVIRPVRAFGRHPMPRCFAGKKCCAGDRPERSAAVSDGRIGSGMG